MMPSKVETLFNGVGPANTDFDTGFLNTADFDSVGYGLYPTGGTLAAVVAGMYGSFDGGVTYPLERTLALSAGSASAGGGWGYGVDASAAFTNGVAYGGPLPPGLKVACPACGAGVSVRIIVWGRRSHRGPDVSMTAD